MRICIIGSSGHTNYVIDGIKLDKDCHVVGIAPGTAQENIADLALTLELIGQQPQVFENYRRMLDDLKPEIVVVASQFNQQASITIEALKRDINVFVEKPVATKINELEDVKAAYKKSEVSLAAMFGIRYKPWFMTAWNLVQDGAVGRVRLINAQKSYRLGSRDDFFKERSTYGGTIPWVGSHAIDWLYWFSGERFKDVYAAHSSKYNGDHGELEVTGLIHFNLSNQVMGSVNIDYLRPDTAPSHGDDRIRIAGTKGIIEVRDEQVFLINQEKEGIQEVSLEENEGIFIDFLRQVRGEGKCIVSAEDSFYITEACLKARQSADENIVIKF